MHAPVLSPMWLLCACAVHVRYAGKQHTGGETPSHLLPSPSPSPFLDPLRSVCLFLSLSLSVSLSLSNYDPLPASPHLSLPPCLSLSLSHTHALFSFSRAVPLRHSLHAPTTRPFIPARPHQKNKPWGRRWLVFQRTQMMIFGSLRCSLMRSKVVTMCW